MSIININDVLKQNEMNALRLLLGWLEKRGSQQDAHNVLKFNIAFSNRLYFFSEQDFGLMAQLADKAEDLLDVDADSMGMQVKKEVKEVFEQLIEKLYQNAPPQSAFTEPASEGVSSPNEQGRGSFIADAMNDIEILGEKWKQKRAKKKQERQDTYCPKDLSEEDKKYIKQFLTEKSAQKGAVRKDAFETGNENLNQYHDNTSDEKIPVTVKLSIKDKMSFKVFCDRKWSGEYVCALQKYRGFSKDVIIPYGITQIWEDAFFNRKNIRSIVLPDSVVDLRWDVFRDCTSLEKVVLSRSIKTIYRRTFYHCTSLQKIVIPYGVEKIEEYAFAGCKNLETVKLSIGLKSIGDYAFWGCDKLESIVIPESVNTIGRAAFDAARFTIFGRKGTEAERYAKEYGFRFRRLGDDSSAG